jgi:hypothetical protein
MSNLKWFLQQALKRPLPTNVVAIDSGDAEGSALNALACRVQADALVSRALRCNKLTADKALSVLGFVKEASKEATSLLLSVE